jgi:acetyl esterase/lipase
MPYVTYGSDPSQHAELHLPAGTDRAPVAVIVHGGAWLNLFGLEFGRPLAEELCALGVAAYNVEYRRIGDGPGAGGGWPSSGQDVLDALRALSTLDQDVRRRLDLDRVVLIAHSAGAQLVLWAATRMRDDASADPITFAGAVLQAGMLDLVDAAESHIANDTTAAFLGGRPSQLPDIYADASPLSNLPIGIPVVCVHGNADVIVPDTQSRTYCRAANAAGDEAALLTVPNADHFAPITPGAPAWEISRNEAMRMLRPSTRAIYTTNAG